MQNGVSQYVDGTLSKPTSDQVSASEITEWQKMDRKALGDICLGVEDKIINQIQKFNTSKEAWDTLKNLYGKVSKEDVYKIEDDLVFLDLKTFDSIQDFIIKVN